VLLPSGGNSQFKIEEQKIISDDKEPENLTARSNNNLNPN
jgi:hypothetical protein